MRIQGLGALLFFLMAHSVAIGSEWVYEVSLEDRMFLEDGADGQKKNHPSVRFQAEYDYEWNDGADLFVLNAMLRLDQQDSERTHADIREFTWLHVADSWELRTGIRKVFWGVTESQHLVDIINQTDLVESFDGEEKLGQPMVNLSLVQDWGFIDLFWLVGFRERTYAGEDGRLRPFGVVDTDHPVYESGAEEMRSDFAARIKAYLGNWEVGVSHFSGTSRVPVIVDQGRPYYPVIDQTGLDLQYIYDAWIWKLEAISNSGMPVGRYTALTGGFEYTLVGIFKTAIDMGLVVEGLFNDRESEPSFINEHDILVGTRFTFNDEQSTDALVGVIKDVESDDFSFSIEASRRLGDVWKLELEARILEPEKDSKTAAFDDEDFIRAELTRYF